ncbi:hypothetical protein [Paenibacillus spongiae]|uniref:Uncharacterized protein n=1 Tax=Paenibacillus spongiae TaxID=2909671 RepID=A0ABY5S735_9BACL|nr:hypothetical protein [Paenibacillus spongiae]UVI29741.1 hypothetical protein L1F29_30770 [Paenibacillus spongiae]
MEVRRVLKAAIGVSIVAGNSIARGHDHHALLDGNAHVDCAGTARNSRRAVPTLHDDGRLHAREIGAGMPPRGR